MTRDERLGDKMPVRRPAKWVSMVAGASHLSEEWHEMEPSEPLMSEKWVEQHPSSPLMSEKWVDQHPSEPTMSEEWVEMKQSHRMDPYAMHSSEGDRSVGMKDMKKESPDNKVERKTQHNEFGSTREI